METSLFRSGRCVKLRIIATIWLTVYLGVVIMSGGNKTETVSMTQYNKSNFVVDPNFQNVVDTVHVVSPQPSFTQPPSYIVFGGIFSLTFSNGFLNPNGYQNALALQCAVADMNTIGPQRGVNITWFYNIFNDKYQASTAMRAAVEFIQAGITATLGPTQADAALSVISLNSAFNITKLAGVVSIDELSDSQTYDSFFRTAPPDVYAARTIGNLMLYFNWTLVTALYTNGAYGLSGQSAFSDVAVELNIMQTCNAIFPVGGVTGIQETILCLSTSQSTVVLLWMEALDAFNILSSFYNSGRLPGLTFIATASWGDIRDIDYWNQGRFPRSYLEGSISVVPSAGNASIFRDCIVQNKINTSNLPSFEQFFEVTLRCQIPTSDNESVALLPICPGNFTERGVYPNLTCQCSIGDTLDNTLPLYQVNYIYDAAFVLFNAYDQWINNCSEVSAAIGENLCSPESALRTTDINRIINISSFEGVTGYVAFNGNDPVRVSYDLLQRRENGDLDLVGTANKSGNVTIDNNALIWKNGKQPVSMIVPQSITFADPLGWVTLIFIVLALLLVLLCSIYFFINHREKVIKKTSPIFSQLILLGILLCVTSQIFWDVKQSEFTCFTKVWLLALGFGLIMGNLLAKTYRIFKIFNNAQVTSLVIRDIDLLKFTAVVLLIEILFLSIYCFPAGLPRPEAIQSQSDTLLKVYQCRVPSVALQYVGVISLFTINFILVLCAVVVAFLTRNVDSAFNESLYIAYVVYSYFVVAAVLLPLYYTAGDSPSSQSRQFIIRNLGILIPMYFTLFVLFGPKIYLVHKSKKAERRRQEEYRQPEPRRRVVDFATSETPTQFVGREGYVSGGTTGAYATVLRGNGATTTSLTEEDEATPLPDGPRLSFSGANLTGDRGSGLHNRHSAGTSTIETTSKRRDSTTNALQASEPSGLFKSTTKRNE